MKFDHPLTEKQRILAENSLELAHWTVRKYIDSNECVVGLNYEDLLQEASYALCKAAATYEDRNVLFKTYAVIVMRNHLIDYCRRIQTSNQNLPTCSLDASFRQEDTANHLNRLSDTDDDFEEELISDAWVRDFLAKRKAEYSGSAKLGIEALELKILGGYGVSDIAKLYRTRTNLVGAWISKATKKIRSDITVSELTALGVENTMQNP